MNQIREGAEHKMNALQVTESFLSLADADVAYKGYLNHRGCLGGRIYRFMSGAVACWCVQVFFRDDEEQSKWDDDPKRLPLACDEVYIPAVLQPVLGIRRSR